MRKLILPLIVITLIVIAILYIFHIIDTYTTSNNLETIRQYLNTRQ